MTHTEIKNQLFAGKFTSTELEEIALALKYARNQLCKLNAREYRAGDTVSFTSPRSGVTFRGTVERVKQKYVLVSTPQGRYNVPANLLETQ